MSRAFRMLAGTLVAASSWACDPGVLLGPDAAQGVEGVALRGPVCPVVMEGSDCADQPYQAWIAIEDAASGRVIARVRTDEEGRFRVGLVPGAYRLVPESGDPFPVASAQDVEVESGVFTRVTVSFDTGIR